MHNDEKTKLYENIKQEIRSLLISSPKTKYGGLSGSLLYSDYKQLNSGKEIPYGELGFHSFLALLRSMPDVVQIEYKENSVSYRVHPVYNERTAHIQKMVLEQRDKYQFYNENFQSNKLIPLKFYRNNQLPYFHNTLSYIPQKFFISNDRQKESYLVLKPSKTINLLPCASIISTNNEKVCSIQINEKEKENINNEINTNNNHSFTKSINIIEDNLLNIEKDQSLISSPISSNNNLSTSDIIDDISEHQSNNYECSVQTSELTVEEENLVSDNNIFFEISDCNKEKKSKIDENRKLIKRINNAIEQCIHFRYIHRLYKLKFEYRHYSFSKEILLIKSKLETIAFFQYKQELGQFEKLSQLNLIIDDDICQKMFDEYVYLQRNYYYMIKLMKKKQR